jgi:group II intron reverse transcriptase/maturase
MATVTANTKLRHNEYYGQQSTLDELYEQSIKGAKFDKLYEKIIDERNILLAYRNIKANTGSTTKGTDDKTISYIAIMTNEQLVAMVRTRLEDYEPQSIRRVEIPKANGKLRSLGIPTISDRLIQQCILQILEPICEAKFHNHSFGFRPNRSTEHAKATMHRMINFQKLHFVVDIDIKGFFDNVDHGKLLKQMWTMGIQDKKLLCIISAMLKAEIDGVGIPSKGTCQGGIISPLLSNVVLNELDWWISNQWESFITTHNYSRKHKYRGLQTGSNLKEIYIVRYCDDFKIMCRTRDVAERTFIAVKMWLKERLYLEISWAKSKITNLRKKTSEFLGFEIKAVVKGEKRVANSKIKADAIIKIMARGKELIKKIQKKPTQINVGLYNSYVLGTQNYYRIATHSSLDFGQIGYYLDRIAKIRWRQIVTNKGSPDKVYSEKYKGYDRKKSYINGKIIYPISCCRTKNAINFSNKVNKYMPEGRELIHKQIEKVSEHEFIYLVKNPIENRSSEYNDNRISLFSAQCGKCRILKTRLSVHDFHCHHVKSTQDGGNDKYKNLVIFHPDIDMLIHATKSDTIHQLLAKLNLSSQQIEKVNQFRLKVGNIVI